MKPRKRLLIILIILMSAGLPLVCYVVGYLHYVHPMPVSLDRESVEPVFRTGNGNIIRFFRPAVPIDRAVFPSRWKLKRFQLPPTDLAGLRTMPLFRARVQSIVRTTPHNTGISTLRLGLRLESGHFLEVVESAATEQMFARAGALMDSGLHEFPTSWFATK